MRNCNPYKIGKSVHFAKHANYFYQIVLFYRCRLWHIKSTSRFFVTHSGGRVDQLEMCAFDMQTSDDKRLATVLAALFL